MARLLPLLPLLTACAGGDLALTVDAVSDGTSARCGDTVAGGTGSARIADLKWFLSEPRALVDGEAIPLTLVDDGTWQTDDIVLVDLEDGTADCSAQGSAATNDQIVFDAASARTLRDADGLVFTVGVPFDRNHRDPAAEPAPMNDPTTFWAWQSGYKFVRVDLLVGEEASPWNLHLGSTGCASDGATEAPTVACDKPNRPEVSMPWDADTTRIVFDLGATLADVDLTTNAPDSPPGCMASQTDVGDCEPVFGALGMDFTTGACVDGCDAQVAFVTE